MVCLGYYTCCAAGAECADRIQTLHPSHLGRARPPGPGPQPFFYLTRYMSDLRGDDGDAAARGGGPSDEEGKAGGLKRGEDKGGDRDRRRRGSRSRSRSRDRRRRSSRSRSRDRKSSRRSRSVCLIAMFFEVIRPSRTAHVAIPGEIKHAFCQIGRCRVAEGGVPSVPLPRRLGSAMRTQVTTEAKSISSG